MADYRTIRADAGARTGATIDEGLRAHMNKVYGTMSVGLVVTGLVAWALAGLAVTGTPTQYALGNGEYLTGFGYALFASPLKWVVMLLPLGMVFAFGAVMRRASAQGAQLFFYLYAAAMGASLSSIFLVFTGVSIAQTFFATAAGFAALSLYGYTTKRDLSGMGAFLMMGLIGLIVVMVINLFLGSPAIAWAVSVIGVFLFAGLTVYDTQKIKTEYISHAHAMNEDWLAKSAIMGALMLYLDFINLFMFLLQFMGDRR